ncbi:LysM peptidoglycan-binding domain-containing protein [Hymenobacter guriensis]|uniref:LysM peptidoglycan-binding domain-containing protein n=1 Tax=Hymenobacter guriensis TaxID=2793065 RepID=A0ABS0KXX9_9BACT|nr:LysM domain-containing protein [Hymenobacter guriensis]MBG8552728.1 LysM peptidoglycan-binding domain-containing protein [Hymenobacter guriensis]
MRYFFLTACLTLSAALTAHAQQLPETPAPAPLSEDSVKAMSGIVQRGVRQLHDIYYEPSDAQAVKRIEAALQEIPTLNQRLKRYTTSLPREQQLQLAQRLRQQPWQVELQTLLRSPQFQGFNARAAKNPALKSAADRLQMAGFIGAPKPAPTAAAPAVAAAASPAPAAATTRPAVASAATVPAPHPTPATVNPAAPAAGTVAPKAATSLKKHTVQKGETLFSIAKQYGVKAAQLQAWNAKPDDGVKIGEVLTVEAAR